MKILVLTSVYKDNSAGQIDKSTNIVNSFVYKWVKQGHEVIVIHNSHCYPKLIHYIPSAIKSKLEAYMGFRIPEYNLVKEKTYKDNGVFVYRRPIKKSIPHKSPSRKQILKQVNVIENILEKNNFLPDVITGHWASPQTEIIIELKNIYKCKTAVVLHGTDYINSKTFKRYNYLNSIDSLGCRSMWQSKQIKDILKLNKYPFVCSSGIPDEYCEEHSLNLEKFKKIKKWNITYVGRLVAYKNVDKIIKALAELNNHNWELNIVGDGPELKKLKVLAQNLNCSSKVNFLGRVTRNTVMKVLENTHIFAMISTNEIFGLVYLEAMIASCITIASKNGGVDGIISSKDNGFLCEEGNSEELLEIFKYIMEADKNVIENIVNHAYLTASDYSDSRAAEKYLENLK